MASSNDGGPAFPQATTFGSNGMSLRDWFAGQALPAVISATSKGQHVPRHQSVDVTRVKAMAIDAYELADAMLAARKEPTT